MLLSAKSAPLPDKATLLIFVPSRLKFAYQIVLTVIFISLIAYCWSTFLVVGILIALAPFILLRDYYHVPSPCYITQNYCCSLAGELLVIEPLRVGPFLCLVKIARQRYWIWPDHLTVEQFKMFKRFLLFQKLNNYRHK